MITQINQGGNNDGNLATAMALWNQFQQAHPEASASNPKPTAGKSVSGPPAPGQPGPGSAFAGPPAPGQPGASTGSGGGGLLSGIGDFFSSI